MKAAEELLYLIAQKLLIFCVVLILITAVIYQSIVANFHDLRLKLRYLLRSIKI